MYNTLLVRLYKMNFNPLNNLKRALFNSIEQYMLTETYVMNIKKKLMA